LTYFLAFFDWGARIGNRENNEKKLQMEKRAKKNFSVHP
jgi:hypothetical protein